jgi:signal transduction histidine kinase
MGPSGNSSDFVRQIGIDWVELLHQLPGFLIVTSGPDHLVEFANGQARALAGNRELAGQRIGDALPELVDQGFIGIRDEVYGSGEPHRAQGVPISIKQASDGSQSEGYIDFVYQPLKRRDGSVCGLIFAGYDVTEQKRGEEQLRSLQFELMQVFRASVMGAMAMILAHELNQPLAAISNYATAARRLLSGDDGTNTEEALEALRDIEAASQRAAEIIRLVREMMGKGRPLSSPVDLGMAIRQAAGLGLIDAPKKGVTYSLDLTPNLIVSSDPIQLQQVLLNLFRNAVEAMQGCDRRELEVVSSRQGPEAEIRVSDTGPGLPDEVRNRLFEPFVTTKEQGLGIGLSICRGIVERHGGRIWAEDRPGGGTVFCLRLPLSE